MGVPSMGTVSRECLPRPTGRARVSAPPLRWARWTLPPAAALVLLAGSASAQHASYWVGQGGGFFLAGGSGVRDPDSHSLGAFAVSLDGDRFRLRYMRGSLERDEGYQLAFGDNDVDYHAFDGVVTRRVTHLPFELALGVARYEEGFVQPNGSKVFVHHWGPHVSLLREVPLWRFLSAWGEWDTHYLPYSRRQVVVALDIGLGVHL